MIRLWLSRGTSIPVREQLSAQFILGIVSGRLAPGERLPSVRELGRRLNLHANTISATYRDLAKRGWVNQRRGSGVFVRDVQMPERNGNRDMFVSECGEEGLARGFSLDALRSAFGNGLQEFQTQSFLVVDPDADLAHILAAEISEATGCVIPSSGVADSARKLAANTCVLTNEVHAAGIVELLGPVSLRPIHLKSMQDVLAGQKRPNSAVLIALVSRSESILRWASTLLSALGFPADSILLRNPRLANWQRGLSACHIVATDIVSSAELSKGVRPIVFRLVAEQFLAEMRELVTPQKPS
jgi:DNA-binding transcriptional regulator YhcF (GntR family)